MQFYKFIAKLQLHRICIKVRVKNHYILVAIVSYIKKIPVLHSRQGEKKKVVKGKSPNTIKDISVIPY